MKKFHFALSHVSPDRPLTLHVRGREFELKAHDDHSHGQAVNENIALNALPEASQKTFSHYAEIPDDAFEVHALNAIKVTTPHEDPTVSLPHLLHYSYHIHEAHTTHFHKKNLAAGGPRSLPKLTALGMAEDAHQQLDDQQLLEHHLHSDLLKHTIDTSTTVVFHHPDLATMQPAVATHVMKNCIFPSTDGSEAQARQYNAMQTLSHKIRDLGEKFAPVAAAQYQDENGKIVSVNSEVYLTDDGLHTPDELPANGVPPQQWGKIHYKPGDKVYHYNLSDDPDFDSHLETAMGGATQLSSNEDYLQNKKWVVSHGKTTELNQGSQKESQALPGMDDLLDSVSDSSILAKTVTISNTTPKCITDTAGYCWSVKEKTPHHGLHVDHGSLKFTPVDDPDTPDKFEIKIKNTYLRNLGAYYQFFNADGDPLDSDPQPIHISGITNKLLKIPQLVPAVNTIMGAPMPTDPTMINLDFPKDAATLKLLFGGLGTSKWDWEVDKEGFLTTILFEYEIPALFIIAGEILTSTKFFKDFVAEPENVQAVVAVMIPIVGGAGATLLGTNHKVPFFKLASAVAGILLSTGLRKLGEWVTEQAGTAAFSDALPVVGWIIRGAAYATNIAAIATTTGEVASSPATIEVDITRTLSVTAILAPDKAHGEAGNPISAIWPAVATYCNAKLIFEGGTSFELGQMPMPTVTSNAQIEVKFDDVPSGTRLKLIFGVYSKNGWLCGKWESPWADANSPIETDHVIDMNDLYGDTETGYPNKVLRIKEVLVPLTNDTQYHYKESIVYDQTTQKRTWVNATPPISTHNDLDCSATGAQSLCELVGITISDSAYQIGLAWRASGIGLPLDSAASVPSSSQEYALQNLSVLADPQSRYRLSKLAFKNQPSMAYNMAPATGDQISPNNFILDPRHDNQHLRQILLKTDDTATDFGLAAEELLSWGQFPISPIDAIAVHPQRFVIAISTKVGKMQILKLPQQAVKEADAPYAQVVSGPGTRQGLMDGPSAITVALDGKILVMETGTPGSERLQAFDTKGNPVPAFKTQATPSLSATNAADWATSLDSQVLPDAFNTLLHQNYYGYQFSPQTTDNADDDYIDPDKLKATLTAGSLVTKEDAVFHMFTLQGITLGVSPNTPAESTSIHVNQARESWTVTDHLRNHVFPVKFSSEEGYSVYRSVTDYDVHIITPGERWTVTDRYGAQTWLIEADAAGNGAMNVYDYQSTFSINRDGDTYSFRDLGTDAHGYIYVLLYRSAGETLADSDYFVDLYTPDGLFLSRTPDPKINSQPQHISADRLAVSNWRNLFALHYETIPVYEGNTPVSAAPPYTEPLVTEWIPTTPIFSFPLKDTIQGQTYTLANEFNNDNISVIVAEFNQHLSEAKQLEEPNTSVTTLTKSGWWRVQDQQHTIPYDVIWSPQGLQVYDISPATEQS